MPYLVLPSHHSRRSRGYPSTRVLILLLSVSGIGELLPAQTLFMDDAERAVMEPYVVNGWAVGNLGVSPSKLYSHSGMYSYVSNVSGSNTSAYSTFSGTADPLYLKFWIYVPSAAYSLASGSSTRLAGLYSTSSTSTYAVNLVNSSGTFLLQASKTNGTHAFSTNAWHTIELAYGISAQTVSISLDGVLDISLSGIILSLRTASSSAQTLALGPFFLMILASVVRPAPTRLQA